MNEWEPTLGITWLLSRVGLALVFLAGIRVCTVAIPFLLLEPQWYLKMGRELINISPVLLTGTTFLLLTSRIANGRNPEAMEVYWRERQLMRLMAYLYALLIPIQLWSTLWFDQAVETRQGQQLQAVQQQLTTARDSPGGVVRNLRVEQLQAMEAGLLAQKRQTTQRRFSLGVELLRVCSSAGVVVWLLLVACRRQPWRGMR
jgi:hypothetical protein